MFKKWVICLKENPYLYAKRWEGNLYFKLAKVAIISCLENTDFTPVVVFDGEQNSFTDWLDKKGVTVIYYQSSLTDFIINSNWSDLDKYTGLGAYIRADLPVLAKNLGWNDQYILYTDVDVMFLKGWKNLKFNIDCEFIAVAKEFAKDQSENFNTGVMVMNLPNLYSCYNDFKNFCINHIKNPVSPDIFDQAAYRKFFASNYNVLNSSFNWKSYWEHNPKAKLIHFHGIKPYHKDANVLRGEAEQIQRLATPEYYENVNLWESYAKLI